MKTNDPKAQEKLKDIQIINSLTFEFYQFLESKALFNSADLRFYHWPEAGRSQWWVPYRESRNKSVSVDIDIGNHSYSLYVQFDVEQNQLKVEYYRSTTHKSKYIFVANSDDFQKVYDLVFKEVQHLRKLSEKNNLEQKTEEIKGMGQQAKIEDLIDEDTKNLLNIASYGQNININNKVPKNWNYRTKYPKQFNVQVKKYKTKNNAFRVKFSGDFDPCTEEDMIKLIKGLCSAIPVSEREKNEGV